MTAPAGWTRLMLEALAAHLGEVTSATWRPTGAYLAGDTAITIARRPTSPDRLIVLTPYVSGYTIPGLDSPGLQVWFRGEPGYVLDLADEVDEALNGLHDIQLGPAWLTLITRKNGDDLGADQGTDPAGRHERVHNYYLKASRQWPHYAP